MSGGPGGRGRRRRRARKRNKEKLAELLLEKAVALESEGRLDEAISGYERVVGEDPSWALAWTDLGNARASAGRTREAECAYRQALALDPLDADALNELAWLLLEKGERLAEAEDLARKAAAAGGSPADAALDTLGRVLLAKGNCEDLSAARPALEAARAAKPDEATSRAIDEALRSLPDWS